MFAVKMINVFTLILFVGNSEGGRGGNWSCLSASCVLSGI